MSKTQVERIHLARRAGRVSRYHTVDLLRPEKVSEHSFNVFNILIIITEGRVSRGLTLAALMHDMGEYMIGDLPSPVKRAMSEETKAAVDAQEESFIDEIHPIARDQITDDERWLLKICDNLDGLIKCTEEVKLGNHELIWVGKNYCMYLEDLITTMQVRTKQQTGLEVIIEHFTDTFFEEAGKHERQ